MAAGSRATSAICARPRVVATTLRPTASRRRRNRRSREWTRLRLGAGEPSWLSANGIFDYCTYSIVDDEM